MKHMKSHIPYALALIAAFFAALPLHAYDIPDVVTSCGEYYTYSVTNTLGGTVTVTRNGSCWTLTAVPETGWKFLYWEDDHDNTNPVRELSNSDFVGADLEKTFEAKFCRVILNCASPQEYMVTTYQYDYGTPGLGKGGRIDTATVDGKMVLKIIDNGFLFAQWADGYYGYNRTIDFNGTNDTTFYATFLEAASINIRGTITEWGRDSVELTVKSIERALDGYSLTIFYDDQLVQLTHPRNVDYGVYKVYAPYSAENVGKNLHIVYKNSDCEPVAIFNTTIPVVVAGDTTISSVPSESTSVHVMDGGTVTFTGSAEINELDIHAGGSAIVDGELVAAAVSMRADTGTCAPNLFLTSNGSLINNNYDTVNLYFSVAYNDFYPFALPYEVSTTDVTYRDRVGGSADQNFVLGTYSGENRAAGSSQKWVIYHDKAGYNTYSPALSEDNTIESAKGYFIYGDPQIWPHETSGSSKYEQKYGVFRFPMTVPLYGGESATSINVETYSSSNRKDKNWNLVALPYLTSYTGAITTNLSTEQRYVIVPEDNRFHSYTEELASRAILKPFQPFFVQVEDGVTALYFNAPSSPAAPGVAAAPKRYTKPASQSTAREIAAGITLAQNGKSDHTGIFISDQYTPDYDINADLTKTESKSSKLRLYSLLGSNKLAYMAIPPASGNTTLETVIPIGYEKAIVGAPLTFAIDSRRFPELLYGEDVYALELVDNIEGVSQDLLEGSYTCTALQASDNNRFALHVVYRAPQQQEIATDICDTPRATALPDGLYDLLGRRIQDTSALPAGAYIRIANGEARKEVIR